MGRNQVITLLKQVSLMKVVPVSPIMGLEYLGIPYLCLYSDIDITHSQENLHCHVVGTLKVYLLILHIVPVVNLEIRSSKL